MYRITARHWRNGYKTSKRLLANQYQPKLQKKIEDKSNEHRNSEPVVLVFPNLLNVPKHLVLNPDVGTHPFEELNIKHKKSKKTVRLEWQQTPEIDLSKLPNRYLMLSKFRLTSLVVITTMGGYAMAPAPFDLTIFALCSIGTGLCSAAANSINQYHEVPFDAQMSRTKNRVLVKGLLTPLHAIGFAIASATTGISLLYFGVNGLTAALGAGNLFLYTSIYTPMKRFSILNTWVGSIVGAIPPVMGWVGCSGTIDTGAWILAGLLYAWQFPHFNALSWNLRPDYSRAGYRMMAVTNPDLCRRTALRYTFGIAALSIAAPALDVTNWWFALETLPLNAYFTYLAYDFYKNSESGSSRKLFRFSLIHLPVLMVLFLLNKKRWIFAENATESATIGANVQSKVSSTDLIVLQVSDEMVTNGISVSKGNTSINVNNIEKLENEAVKAFKGLLR